MKNQNYKTTWSGIACLALAGVFSVVSVLVPPTAPALAPIALALVPVGIGFINAKDDNTTGIGANATKVDPLAK